MVIFLALADLSLRAICPTFNQPPRYADRDPDHVGYFAGYLKQRPSHPHTDWLREE